MLFFVVYIIQSCYTPKFSVLFLRSRYISILKNYSRVDQTNPLLSNQPKLGFCHSQVKMDFQCSKWPSYLILCFKESPCQVSSLTSQNCSSNCSDSWKSAVLDKKSIMVNIQSNFIIFGQHQYFEVIFIIWSRVDHYSSRKFKI